MHKTTLFDSSAQKDDAQRARTHRYTQARPITEVACPTEGGPVARRTYTIQFRRSEVEALLALSIGQSAETSAVDRARGKLQSVLTFVQLHGREHQRRDLMVAAEWAVDQRDENGWRTVATLPAEDLAVARSEVERERGHEVRVRPVLPTETPRL
jgi:hypothetical protein